jgi:hypothetical protein
MPKSDGERIDELKGREWNEHTKYVKEQKELKKKKQEEDAATWARLDAEAKLPESERKALEESRKKSREEHEETVKLEVEKIRKSLEDAPLHEDSSDDFLGGGDPDDSAETKAEVPLPPELKLTREKARELLEAVKEANDFGAVLKAIKSVNIKPDLKAYISKGNSSAITISLNPRDFQRLAEIQNIVYEKKGQRIVISKAAKIAIRLANITEDNIFKVMEALEREDKRVVRKRRKLSKAEEAKESLRGIAIMEKDAKRGSRKHRKARKR